MTIFHALTIPHIKVIFQMMNVMVRYFSYQSENVSGDISLDLLAKAVLLINQHPDFFMGKQPIIMT